MTASTPSPEERRLWMGLARLVSHLSREAGRAVQEAEGINLSEMTLMGQVRRSGGQARMVDLAERLQLTKPAITKIVDSLERRSYLERRPDERDGRVVLAAITNEGKEALKRAERAFEQVMRLSLWDHLGSDELHRLVRTLDRIQSELGLGFGAVMPP